MIQKSREELQTGIDSDILQPEINENMWVTVFGFPINSTSLVLSRFASCGVIIEKQFPTQGNWIHLKYGSLYEVRKALSLNGKCISNVIMVGVIPYHNKHGTIDNMSISAHLSPLQARPMRHSSTFQQSSQSVLSSESVPQKSVGIVNKAMEYILGW